MANNNGFSFEDSLKELGIEIDTLGKAMVEKAKRGVEALALQTHAMIVEEAQKLKATRRQYLDNLSVQKIYGGPDQEIWSVSLRQQAEWIENGYPRGEMIDKILRGGKPPKIAKDGAEYKTIPFKYKGVKKSDMSAAQNRLANYVKNQLTKQGLDKIITGADGKPIIGKAASVKITDPKQPLGRFAKPLLSGLTIYQTEQKTKSGGTKIKQSVMTFRTISSNQKGSGMWENKSWKGLGAFNTVENKIESIWKDMVNDIIKGTK